MQPDNESRRNQPPPARPGPARDAHGLRYLIIGYGHSRQLVVPAAAGHVLVASELASAADHLQAILLGGAARHERPA
jgi:hypothetical protein